MNIFVIAGIVAFIFFVIKFSEMRFIQKENQPLKLIVKDTLCVFASVVVGNYVVEQLTPTIALNTEEPNERIMKPPVFLGNPDF